MAFYEDINGREYPIFKIYDLNDNMITTIALDYCGSGDLVEEYEFHYIKYQALDYSEKVQTQGFHINFTLDYKEYSSRDDMDKIKELSIYLLNNVNYQIYLIPRSDYMYRKFLVNPANDKWTIKNLLLQGTEGMELQFRTAELQTEINWINPSKVIYHGTYIYPYTGVLEVA